MWRQPKKIRESSGGVTKNLTKGNVNYPDNTMEAYNLTVNYNIY